MAPLPSPVRQPLFRPGRGRALRVLVVDDEESLASLVATVFRAEGCEVASAGDGATALAVARDFRPDAVILDILLPDIDGLQVLRRLRGDQPDLPVLLLTARDSVQDRISGFTAGGDDYVTKPFSPEEVVLRLHALVRRSRPEGFAIGPPVLRVGDLTVDKEGREVRRAGEPIQLTTTEFELLVFLMRNARRVLSKAQILDRVWSYDFGGSPNIVELYISYLRRKIDAGREPMIHTVRGVGYVLRPPG